MEIKNIKIKNIRSYTDEEIDFPKGTTLLSGNIGTGKSTILLAIEFALFGITKELPGSALLRNGTKKGSVELNFNIQDKDITIKRTLKKGTSITQDTGSIAINGAKKDASATELKQNILTLLNYPQELLTKTKSLIYRYTVYTPQEEMKNILTGNKEYKIDTLRKVFGIDKYKLLRENAETFISKIKTKNKEFAISIADLENKKDEAIIIGTKIKNSKLKLNDFLPTLEKIKENIKENKKNIEIFENKIKEIQNIKNNINIITTKIDHKLQENKNNKDRLLQLKENIKLTEEEIKKEQPQTIEEKTLLNKEKELLALEKELKNLSNKAQDLKTSKKHIEKIIEDISKLDFCPLCKQNVGKDHIHKVKTEESKKITKYTEELEKTLVEEENKESIIKSLKEYIENLKKEQQKANLLNIKITNLEEKKKELIKIKECEIEIKKEIGSLNTEKLASLNQIKNNEEIENKFKKIKEDLEELNKKERQLEIEKATLGKEIQNNEENLNKLKIEIENKSKIKDKITYLKILQNWLEKQFLNITAIMERKIMLKVHNDFNKLFQKWFEMLVDSEIIKVKLDEEFSPIIEQNGHEINYSHLSGGEKTAAALAYRLALNQVINTLVSTIKTRDLLILDEPTDGFSSEQLDRLRNILEELDAKQIILVSHENKIESFVNNVIKLDKKEHISYATYT